MHLPFYFDESGKLRIVGAKVRSNAQAKMKKVRLSDSWGVVMTMNSRGQFIASGFTLSQ